MRILRILLLCLVLAAHSILMWRLGVHQGRVEAIETCIRICPKAFAEAPVHPAGGTP